MSNQPTLADRLMEIGARATALPVLDPRPPHEILGYDDFGVFCVTATPTQPEPQASRATNQKTLEP